MSKIFFFLFFFFFTLERTYIWIRARLLNALFSPSNYQVTESLCISITFCQQCGHKQLPSECFPPAGCIFFWNPFGFWDHTITWVAKPIQSEDNQVKKDHLKTIFCSLTWFCAQSCRSGSSMEYRTNHGSKNAAVQEEFKNKFVSLYAQTYHVYSIRKECRCWCECCIPELLWVVT